MAGKHARIAVIGGDGTGPEVVAEGLKVLGAVGEKSGFTFETKPTFSFSTDNIATICL